jgi:two-component system, HptB-dependent secretion and biofilm response regulator
MNNSSLAIKYESKTGVKKLVKALVVEDKKLDQYLMREVLSADDYDVVLASTGKEAIDIFIDYQPDIVFMDINLPDVSGYSVTRELKEISQEKYIPVIFVTGTYDDEILEKCFASGGDDFILKPVKQKLLIAKAKSLLRLKEMHDDLLHEKQAISGYSDEQLKDLYDADNVIHNIHKPRFYDSGNLDWSYIPQNILSGDIVCSAIDPSGNQVILVGDNTGHGLPAAIGSIITCETFYSMVHKGFDIGIIIEEINKKLCYLLPTDRFLSACIMEFDIDYQSMNIWNAGMPEVYIINKNKELKDKIVSVHLPLGIVLTSKNDIKPTRVELDNGDRVYSYTDGLIEVFNNNGEVFGENRLIESIKTNYRSKLRVDAIINDTKVFCNNAAATDDVLLLEIDCNKSRIKKVRKTKNHTQEIKPMNWDVNFDLKTEVICKSNPVPVIIQALVDMQGFNGHREKIFLILTEMYSNALEHGILKLDSSIKEKQNGFHDYYVLRQDRLNDLSDGNIRITISHFIDNGNGVISITIEDSGNGFDYAEVIQEIHASSTAKSGRGIALLRDLCRKCEYSEGGSKLNVEYEWQHENLKNVA